MKKIFVVGLGPGNEKYMTQQARAALEESDVLCGYTVYLDLITHLYPDKKVLTTPMKQEIERCNMALQEASDGKTVSMVCSGDAGVYGMAGLIYQLSVNYPQVEIEIVPGITAAMSGAAVLGAPLIHDFAVISLSDLLTPWEKIEKRVSCAAEADFVICIYNPSSKKRQDYLQKACDIIMQHQSPKTVAGIVRNIGRDGQEAVITTLDKLRDMEVDMFTTVFIGNSSTIVLDGKMVTPRGYEKRMSK
ncbi:MAG: precorrin-3B C(17)-methyltransferase [Oscillospiraceae bacterium]